MAITQVVDDAGPHPLHSACLIASGNDVSPRSFWRSQSAGGCSGLIPQACPSMPFLWAIWPFPAELSQPFWWLSCVWCGPSLFPHSQALSQQHMPTITQGSLQDNKSCVLHYPALYSAALGSALLECTSRNLRYKKKKKRRGRPFWKSPGKEYWGAVLFMTLRLDVSSSFIAIYSFIFFFPI